MSDKEYKCADCGVSLTVPLHWGRRMTPQQIRDELGGALVATDNLCKPCWKKQDHD